MLELLADLSEDETKGLCVAPPISLSYQHAAWWRGDPVQQVLGALSELDIRSDDVRFDEQPPKLEHDELDIHHLLSGLACLRPGILRDEARNVLPCTVLPCRDVCFDFRKPIPDDDEKFWSGLESGLFTQTLAVQFVAAFRVLREVREMVGPMTQGEIIREARKWLEDQEKGRVMVDVGKQNAGEAEIAAWQKAVDKVKVEANRVRHIVHTEIRDAARERMEGDAKGGGDSYRYDFLGIAAGLRKAVKTQRTAKALEASARRSVARAGRELLRLIEGGPPGFWAGYQKDRPACITSASDDATLGNFWRNFAMWLPSQPGLGAFGKIDDRNWYDIPMAEDLVKDLGAEDKALEYLRVRCKNHAEACALFAKVVAEEIAKAEGREKAGQTEGARDKESKSYSKDPMSAKALAQKHGVSYENLRKKLRSYHLANPSHVKEDENRTKGDPIFRYDERKVIHIINAMKKPG